MFNTGGRGVLDPRILTYLHEIADALNRAVRSFSANPYTVFIGKTVDIYVGVKPVGLADLVSPLRLEHPGSSISSVRKDDLITWVLSARVLHISESNLLIREVRTDKTVLLPLNQVDRLELSSEKRSDA
tara:strand:+ start:284 stop:670 length:387 start_codon:yes stop_codon:yes gene_type:complete